MNVHVGYTNLSHKDVRHYFMSVFFDHFMTEDIKEKLFDILKPLPLRK